jgi:RHS repeat-associated protein
MGGVLSHRQTTDGQIYNTSYTYNIGGELLDETYPSGRVVRNVLDRDGRVSAVKSRTNANGFWAYARAFSWTPSGAPSSLQLGNGHWESLQLNNRMQVTESALGTTPGATNLLKLDYSYGTSQNNGNVLSQTITVPTVGSNNGFVATQTYSYDELNRLHDATESVSSTQIWKQTFSYDRFGNRNFDEANTTTLTKSCGTSPTYVMCSADRKLQNPSASTSTNRLVLDQDSDSINDYGYDSNGNVTKDALGRTFIYDGRDKATEVKDSSSNTIGQYFYDGDRRRVKKVTSSETTIFVYDIFGKVIAEYADQAPQNPQVAYVTSDVLGTPRIATSAFGVVVSRHDYYPFGAEISSSQRTTSLGYAADSVRRTFTGYENDNETDLEFAQARYYSTSLGRFYSVDAAGASAHKSDPQSLNRYGYVRNNPLNLTDPSGLVPQTQSCGHVNENPCKTKNGQPGWVVTVDGSDEKGKAEKHNKPWYKRAWNWVKNQVSPTASAQAEEVEDPAEREPLTESQREDLLRSDGSETREEVVGRPLTAAEKTEVFRSMNPGSRPDDIPCFINDPEPSASLGNSEVPEEAFDVLNEITRTGGAPPQGYVGGRGFLNDGRDGGQILPQTTQGGDPILYREYDIRPLTRRSERGLDRIVTGSDGSAYFTNDHYTSFIRIH